MFYQLRITKTALFILISAAIFVFSSSQQLIENPKKPLSQNAGRLLKLQEVWRITDESGEFFFSYPGQLQLDNQGNIFMADKDQLLKFSAEGKLIKNLLKKGQGPGEISGHFYYYLHQNKIFIWAPEMIRIIQLDLEGNLISQFEKPKDRFNNFCGVNDHWFIFVEEAFPPPGERKGKLYDLPCTIKLLSHDGSQEKESSVFGKKVFLAPQAAAFWAPWHSVMSRDGSKLYICHTREYFIEVLDLEESQVIRQITRDYPSVKHREQDWEKDFSKKYGFPRIKYEMDIRGLYLNNDSLWVLTSTADKNKGDMIDVFDASGRFVDNFFLGPERQLLAAQGEFLFCLEKTEAENVEVVKYRIMEK